MGIVGLAADLWLAERGGARSVLSRQRRRLAETIAFAAAHSAYFAEHYRGLDLSHAPLDALPPTDKHQLLMRFDDWVTDPRVTYRELASFAYDRPATGEDYLGDYSVWTTSGSSGESGVFLHDARERALFGAFYQVRSYLPATSPRQLVAKLWLAVRRQERQAWVYIPGGRTPEAAVIYRRRRNPRYARESRLFSIQDSISTLVAQLNAYQPTLLGSYPSLVALLAEEQLAGRLHIYPRLVTMGGENLEDEARGRIRQAFGAEPHDQYSTSETGPIAFRCHRGWFHVNADWVVVEPVDADLRPVPAGQPSDAILVTSLASRVQPIIRYRLTDSVVMRGDRCECGNRLPALRVEGRRGEALRLPTVTGGTVTVPPLAILGLIRYAVQGVYRFQVIQTTPSTFRVRLAAQAGHNPAVVWDAVERQLRQLETTHGVVPLQIVRAPEPPQPDPRSGKFRQVWSALPED